MAVALEHSRIVEFARRFIEEDTANGDITSAALLNDGQLCTARIFAKQNCVVAGLAVAEQIFKYVNPKSGFKPHVRDGETVSVGGLLASLYGGAADILKAERSALNVLQRMCGIATLTSSYVTAVMDTGAQIYDTRKTAPGLRLLDKYAVACGGGNNHRLDLGAAILVKDNHIGILKHAGMKLGQIVAKARAAHPTKPVEVEVATLAMARSALRARADVLLLDNMSPAEVHEVATIAGTQSILEASGGLNLDNIRAYAEAGVQRLSVGALTHSVVAADIALNTVG